MLWASFQPDRNEIGSASFQPASRIAETIADRLPTRATFSGSDGIPSAVNVTRSAGGRITRAAGRRTYARRAYEGRSNRANAAPRSANRRATPNAVRRRPAPVGEVDTSMETGVSLAGSGVNAA